MHYLDSLNPAQRDAVTAGDGPMIVNAGAGSGKTRVLTMRIAYLIEHGVNPHNILALTFTNKAAAEMKSRISHIVGDEISRQLWMGTFHSMFARILRSESASLGFQSDFSIYDTQDSRSLIKTIIKDMKLDDKLYKPSAVLGIISSAKNELILPANFESSVSRPAMADIYRRYAEECRKSNALDFDDLLLYTNVLFRNHPDILQKYQQRFTHILVDEYQDTNRSQYVIIRRMAEKTRNICVVGDDSQSIYSFRGARIENILNFSRDYPSCKIFKLEQNYRSSQNIVNVANGLIEHNINRLQKTVFSDNDEGDKVRVIATPSDRAEAATICRDIASCIQFQGLPLSAFAILYRTNAQSRAFEEELRSAHLKYKVYGGLAFYQRKEIKDLLAYMRLVSNHDDGESLKRIINYPARGIGASTLDKVAQIALSNDLSLWDAMQPQTLAAAGISPSTAKKIGAFTSLIDTFTQQANQLNAYGLCVEILTQSGIMRELTAEKEDIEGKERFQNVQELLGGLREFCDQRQETGEPDDLRTYLAEVALITDFERNEADGEEHIRLMTIHSSKGLEFDNVYIVGVEEDIFPGAQSAGDAQKIEEERRLFYVALTRARKCATISYAQARYQYGKSQSSRPSRFIAELDKRFITVSGTAPSASPWSGFQRKTQDRSFSGFSRSASSASSSQPHFQRPMVERRLHSISREAPSTNANEHQASASFNGNTYTVGMPVVHETFGRGHVVDINGVGPNTKLIIDFESVGQKHLLLKFARLKPLK